MLLATILVFWYWIKPTWIEVQKLRGEQKTFSDFLNKTKETKIIRDDLLSVYNSIPPAELERLKKIVPREIEKEKILVQFEDLALKNGLSIKSFDILQKKTEKGETIPTAPKLTEEALLNLDLAGNYESFLNFLKDAERSLRITDIYEISFKATDKDFYTFSLKAKTYFQK
jgi:Tfp pilus assembly protein PilO